MVVYPVHMVDVGFAVEKSLNTSAASCPTGPMQRAPSILRSRVALTMKGIYRH